MKFVLWWLWGIVIRFVLRMLPKQNDRLQQSSWQILSIRNHLADNTKVLQSLSESSNPLLILLMKNQVINQLFNFNYYKSTTYQIPYLIRKLNSIKIRKHWDKVFQFNYNSHHTWPPRTINALPLKWEGAEASYGFKTQDLKSIKFHFKWLKRSKSFERALRIRNPFYK